MKSLSINQFINKTKKVVIRYPVKVLLIIIATTVAVWMVDRPVSSKWPTNNDMARLLCFCNLAIVLSLATDLYSDSRLFSVSKKWLYKLFAIFISAVIMFFLDPLVKFSNVYVIALFALAFHLMVAFAPFLGKSGIENFWHFNKTLFIRLLTSVLYSGVITLGLFLAIFAIRKLFNADIDTAVFPRTFLVVAIGFNTIFFLAGIPDVRSGDYGDNIYPKGLKIFTQYVLIPLMTVYLIILLLYEVKILIEWKLPDGYVSMLILAYAAFGILSLLLIYPIRNQEGNRWIKWFFKWFYITMIPLLLLLVLAIYTRVSQYGVTEERYALIALAVWLLGITLYFLLSKKDNIKVIPISLTIVALLAAAGPQSASSVSKWSQQNRMEKHYPVKNKKDAQEAVSIIKYLAHNHGITSLQKFTKVNLKNIQQEFIKESKETNTFNEWKMSDTAFVILNVKDTAYSTNYVTFYNGNDNEIIKTDSFDYVKLLDTYASDYHFQIDSVDVHITRDNLNYTITFNKKEEVTLSLKQLINSIETKYNKSPETKIILPDSEMCLNAETKSMKIKLMIYELVIYDYNSTVQKPEKLYLLLKKKQ